MGVSAAQGGWIRSGIHTVDGGGDGRRRCHCRASWQDGLIAGIVLEGGRRDWRRCSERGAEFARRLRCRDDVAGRQAGTVAGVWALPAKPWRSGHGAQSVSKRYCLCRRLGDGSGDRHLVGWTIGHVWEAAGRRRRKEPWAYYGKAGARGRAF